MSSISKVWFAMICECQNRNYSIVNDDIHLTVMVSMSMMSYGNRRSSHEMNVIGNNESVCSLKHTLMSMIVSMTLIAVTLTMSMTLIKKIQIVKILEIESFWSSNVDSTHFDDVHLRDHLRDHLHLKIRQRIFISLF